MQYRELLRGVNAFATQGKNTSDRFPKHLYLEGSNSLDLSYFDAQEKLKRDKSNIPQIAKHLLEFVNKWRSGNRNDSYIQHFLEWEFQQIKPDLFTYKLQAINLLALADRIKTAFEGFNRPLNTTATSRALHILNPHLFPMWDTKIRNGYGFAGNSQGYWYFMQTIQREVEEVASSYNDRKPLSKRLYWGREKTLLKLLDEYHYAKFTKEWI